MSEQIDLREFLDSFPVEGMTWGDIRKLIAANLASERARLRNEMAVEFDDPRLRYVTVQINRPTWNELNEKP